MKPRPLVIPVFIPHKGCPHRCLFCDQNTITQTTSTSFDGSGLIGHALKLYQPRGRTDDRSVEIAFFGGNFLGLQPNKVVELLTVASKWIDRGRVDSIRFSTRPDTIDAPRMKLIAPFEVKTIEIGAQSMDDAVLEASERGHNAEDTLQAVERVKKGRYRVGIQLMVGLPGESDQTIAMNRTAVCHLAPDFVRIYPTLVLAGSPLAKVFCSGKYQPLTLDEAVKKSAILASGFLKNNISVIRMGLPADVAADPDRLLAGPYHPAFGHLVYERLYLHAAKRVLSDCEPVDSVTFRVHPKGVSTMRGLGNGNVTKLTERFKLKKLAIVPDSALSRYQVALGNQCHSILMAS